MKALNEAGFIVAVVNPTRVRRFAEALVTLAKTVLQRAFNYSIIHLLLLFKH